MKSSIGRLSTSVEIAEAKRIVDLECYRGVTEASLFQCPNLVDISSLCTASKVHLFYCDKITSVDSLITAQDVQIHNCQGIHDVSPLGNVEKLYLGELTLNMASLSSLINVHDLTLVKISNLLDEHLFALGKNIRKLTLKDCNEITNNLSCLSTIHDLTISSCRGITNVSSLSNVKRSINLSRINEKAIGFHALGNVQELELLWIPSLTDEDFKCLGTVLKVTLNECHGITQIPYLSHTRELRVIRCMQVTDVSPLGSGENIPKIIELSVLYGSATGYSFLGHCQQLELRNVLYDGLKDSDLISLGKVHKLTLENCLNIVNVNPLVTVKDLTLKGCSKVNDVSKLVSVPKLTIYYCGSITEWGELKKPIEREGQRDYDDTIYPYSWCVGYKFGEMIFDK